MDIGLLGCHETVFSRRNMCLIFVDANEQKPNQIPNHRNQRRLSWVYCGLLVALSTSHYIDLLVTRCQRTD